MLGDIFHLVSFSDMLYMFKLPVHKRSANNNYSKTIGRMANMPRSDTYKYDMGEAGLFLETKLLSLVKEENIPCPDANSSHELSTDFNR